MNKKTLLLLLCSFFALGMAGQTANLPSLDSLLQKDAASKTQMANIADVLIPQTFTAIESSELDAAQKEALFFKCVRSYMNETKVPLSATTAKFVSSHLGTIELKGMFFELQHKLATPVVTFKPEDCVMKNDAFASLTDGKEILTKLLEPYRGKVVYMDFWGTWCVPCKLALKNNTPKVLKAFENNKNVEFVFFAHESPQVDWIANIRQYNISGANVAHYNIPVAQQNAVLKYLGINSFPTYILVKKDGTILHQAPHPAEFDKVVSMLKAGMAE